MPTSKLNEKIFNLQFKNMQLTVILAYPFLFPR